MKSTRWVAGLIALGLVCAGCGGTDGDDNAVESATEVDANVNTTGDTTSSGASESGDFSRDDGIALLVDDGMSTEGATCFVDAMVADFGIDKMNSTADLTPAEETRVQEISVECGLDDELAAVTSEAQAETSSAVDETPEEAPQSLFGALDFAPACRGVGIGAATPYVADDGLNHIVGVVGQDPTYDQGLYSALADGWEAEWEVIDQTELVVCLDRTALIDGEICTGYKDDDSGLEWEVQTFGGDYGIKLREATTAAVVAETTLTVEPDSCPSFSFFSSGDPSPQPDYAVPGDALQAWLVAYVGS